MLIAMMGAAAAVVGLIGALALDSWWILVGAVLVHVVASGVVLIFIGKQLQNRDKPDPVTEARLEEEGSI